MSAKPRLGKLKELESLLEDGKSNDVHKCLEVCWEEFHKIERDEEIPSEVCQKICTALEEITIALEALEAGAITIKEFNRIKTKVFEQ
ncbi:MAG: hypothetical protein QXO71_01745 [Candidatus Jordarchaeaceae archaeon]